MWVNDRQRFGWLNILLHWTMAITIVALFFLGIAMVDLDYYSEWYNKAPRIHESVGLILFALLTLKIIQRLFDPPPGPLASLKFWEIRASAFVHAILYTATIVVLFSGYLISSADNETINVFNWFSVPTLQTGVEHQQDVAGVWHRRIAWLLIIAAGLHALAAVKHHFIDRDATLKRMLGLNR